MLINRLRGCAAAHMSNSTVSGCYVLYYYAIKCNSDIKQVIIFCTGKGIVLHNQNLTCLYHVN